MKTKVHWNIFEGKWTVRTYKSCGRFDSVLVKDWKTEVKPEYPNNPRGWIYADSKNVVVNPDEDMLNGMTKGDQLVYNKHKMFFNITEGETILCDDDGCFVVVSDTEINSP